MLKKINYKETQKMHLTWYGSKGFIHLQVPFEGILEHFLPLL